MRVRRVALRVDSVDGWWEWYKDGVGVQDRDANEGLVEDVLG